MTIFKTDDRVRLNKAGLDAYDNADRGVNWPMRRGYVDASNSRGGGEVLVTWNGLKGSCRVPAEYLEVHEIGTYGKI